MPFTQNLLSCHVCQTTSRLIATWRLPEAKRTNDFLGIGAAINGGRWNIKDFSALCQGEMAAICCLEHFGNASGPASTALVLAQVELLGDEDLCWEPADIPPSWGGKSVDTPSMAFGTVWLRSSNHLVLIVPSAFLLVQRSLVINPRHPACFGVEGVEGVEGQEFFCNPRVLQSRT